MGQVVAFNPSKSSQHIAPSTFLIGKDHRGHWVVRDIAGLRGGLFVNRAEAVRFATRENGDQPRAAIMMPGILEPWPDASFERSYRSKLARY